MFLFDSLNIGFYGISKEVEEDDDADVREKFGIRCVWGPLHRSVDELEVYRKVGDPKLDRLLGSLNPPLGAHEDLWDEDRRREGRGSSRSQAIQDFVREYAAWPPWVDVDQLERGQRVFLAYAPAMGLALFYRSLVAGFSIPKIAAVVRSTAYLSPPSSSERVAARLVDTYCMVAACTALGVEALTPGTGEGWKACLRVRVLHAKVRRSLLQRQKRTRRNREDGIPEDSNIDTDSETDEEDESLSSSSSSSLWWDIDHYGIPINHEDTAATLLAFAINPIVGVEWIAGRPMNRTDMEDYMALWRYIGWLLGVPTVHDRFDDDVGRQLVSLDPCGGDDPVAHGKALLESVVHHLLDPDETSVEVAHHLLRANVRPHPVSRASPPDRIEEDNHEDDYDRLFFWRALLCRRSIGDPLADALQLPLLPPHHRHSRWMWHLSTLYLLVFRILTLAVMFFPPIRSVMVRLSRSSSQKIYRFRIAKWASGAIVAGSTSTSTAAVNVSCPFAMIHPPHRRCT